MNRIVITDQYRIQRCDGTEGTHDELQVDGLFESASVESPVDDGSRILAECLKEILHNRKGVLFFRDQHCFGTGRDGEPIVADITLYPIPGIGYGCVAEFPSSSLVAEISGLFVTRPAAAPAGLVPDTGCSTPGLLRVN